MFKYEEYRWSGFRENRKKGGEPFSKVAIPVDYVDQNLVVVVPKRNIKCALSAIICYRDFVHIYYSLKTFICTQETSKYVFSMKTSILKI